MLRAFDAACNFGHELIQLQDTITNLADLINAVDIEEAPKPSSPRPGR